MTTTPAQTVYTTADQLHELPEGTIITAVGGSGLNTAYYSSVKLFRLCGRNGGLTAESLLKYAPEWVELRPLVGWSRSEPDVVGSVVGWFPGA